MPGRARAGGPAAGADRAVGQVPAGDRARAAAGPGARGRARPAAGRDPAPVPAADRARGPAQGWDWAERDRWERYPWQSSGVGNGGRRHYRRGGDGGGSGTGSGPGTGLGTGLGVCGSPGNVCLRSPVGAYAFFVMVNPAFRRWPSPPAPARSHPAESPPSDGLRATAVQRRGSPGRWMCTTQMSSRRPGLRAARVRARKSPRPSSISRRAVTASPARPDSMSSPGTSTRPSV